ncbi:MAG: sigma-70 family RNA polymerase sigma factor [Bryobacterales bacterium]|nr:sigma-70 family RNA polymerase sigma factor [Bryobacterales bacterium]
MVRNLLHKHNRGARRIVPFPNLETIPAPPVEHLNDLRRLLHLLTEREQQVILLRMDSLKYHEIAEELQIAPGTVAAILSKALSKLRQCANSTREVSHGKAL